MLRPRALVIEADHQARRDRDKILFSNNTSCALQEVGRVAWLCMDCVIFQTQSSKHYQTLLKAAASLGQVAHSTRLVARDGERERHGEWI